MGIFIDVTLLPAGINGGFQVCFLGIAYAYVLYLASNLISEGSELLLLVPKFSGIVGSVVLPVLGAVPDGAIVLFSGMGANAQERVSVGLGTLAGSTIMLITIPWALSIWAGLVPKGGVYVHGNSVSPTYMSNASAQDYVAYNSVSIQKAGQVMLMTSLLYCILQGPATYVDYFHISKRWWAVTERYLLLIGIGCTALAFVMYLIVAMLTDNVTEIVADRKRQKRALQMLHAHAMSLDAGIKLCLKGVAKNDPLLRVDAETKKRLSDFLTPIFYDVVDTDGTGTASYEEIKFILTYFGSYKQFGGDKKYKELFQKFDVDKSGEIDFDEFIILVLSFITCDEVSGDNIDHKRLEAALDHQNIEHEVPDEFHKYSITEVNCQLMKKAFTMLFIGTSLVLLFSDPMCSVFENLGQRTGIPPFYLSFLLAPMASNAAEALASIRFAGMKTVKSFEVALSSLTGAAIMNNTFCLMIFYIICLVKGLNWSFGPEVGVTLLIEVLMFYYSQKALYTKKDAIVVALLLPLSLVLITVIKY